MKKLVSGLLVVLMVAMTILISPVNKVLADSPGNISQQQLQEDLVKYSYPYSDVPVNEREQLAQYEINTLNQQVANFQPGGEYTLNYLENALANMQKLLGNSSQTHTTPSAVTNSTSSTAPVAINMIYYGQNSILFSAGETVEQAIINAQPEFLVDNSAAGPWDGDANVSQYKSAGIKYFEYLAGGYEGKIKDSIPDSLQANLKYIAAAAKEGAYGIFLDQVSDGIYTTANYSYLSSIYNEAHSLGLKVVFNTGVSTWASKLMNYCDYMNSSENWQIGTSLTTIQSKYAKQIWMETEGVTGTTAATAATTAANLTEAAWSDGILAEYACNEYIVLPSWLPSYVSDLRLY
jgi:hypothetical protein